MNMLSPLDLDPGELEAPPRALRLAYPAVAVIWLCLLAFQTRIAVRTGGLLESLALILSVLLFAGVRAQLWYEEFARSRELEQLAGRIRRRTYEDKTTFLPNSRLFVTELHRRMARVVRGRRTFSLALTDLTGIGTSEALERLILPPVARAVRASVGHADFVAHLQDAIFAAILIDEDDRPIETKAGALLAAVRASIPAEVAGTTSAVVSVSAYQGELEVRDFLRRAQSDLVLARASFAAQSEQRSA